MVFFRTDANNDIGAGHTMRCLTIANEMKERNMDVIFIVSNEESTDIIKRHNINCLSLERDWKLINEEGGLLLNLIGKYMTGNDYLIVDSYLVTNDYFHNFSNKMKVIYFDDLFDEFYDVDLLINYNLYYDMFPYGNRYGSTRTKMLLGGKYVPLRKQFIHYSIWQSSVKEVLLICGGGDKYGVLIDIVKNINKNSIFSNIRFNVVLGNYYHSYVEMRDESINNNNINVYRNVDDMAGLMKRCQIAISAAGTVLYELCAMKVPTIFFCMADNQEYDRLVFGNKLMVYSGDIRKDRNNVIKTIMDQLEIIINNPEQRKNMYDNMGKVVDAYGAKRIVDEIKML